MFCIGQVSRSKRGQIQRVFHRWNESWLEMYQQLPCKHQVCSLVLHFRRRNPRFQCPKVPESPPSSPSPWAWSGDTRRTTWTLSICKEASKIRDSPRRREAKVSGKFSSDFPRHTPCVHLRGEKQTSRSTFRAENSTVRQKQISLCTRNNNTTNAQSN